ncbi:MAG TPA: glycerol-3-phosphate ABC transporter permease [Ruminococcaceae bacterium]|nr:glycerol-3-phosphate ABC transporter permease [Oscillospiraceae bacterium]
MKTSAKRKRGIHKTLDTETTLQHSSKQHSSSRGFSAAEQRKTSARTSSHGEKKWVKLLTPYLFLAPASLCFAVFLFFPFLRTIYLSLFLTNNEGYARVFRGIKNYVTLFTSPDYRKVMGNTLVFALIVIVGSMALGFLTANLANGRGRAFRIFPIVFTMPIAAAAGSFALLFQKMFDPNNGVVNKLLQVNTRWFQDPNIALYSMAVITIWLMSGSNFLYLHAGLRNIPKSILESAEIDGAGGFTKLFRITVPCLSPMLFFVLITDIIAAFQSFTQINVITQGGPGNATNIMVYNIYRDAFFNFRFGPAAAQSIVLFLIILVITLIQFKNEKRMVFYS